MMNNIQKTTDLDLGRQLFNKLNKPSECLGKMMVYFKTGIQVIDESTKKTFYLSLSTIRKALFGDSIAFSCPMKKLIDSRILEITNPDTRTQISKEKIQDLFQKIIAHKFLKPKGYATQEGVLKQLEILKQSEQRGPNYYFNENLSEIKSILKPGDILVRKFHEDNRNVICIAQNLFKTKGFREAYKCSHLALYVGMRQEAPWIAEATFPEGNDIEVHRIKLDDPRFRLKNKNQYMVFRNRDENLAVKTAKLASNYAVKMLPNTERTPTPLDKKKTFKFNAVEATRSLWHSSKLKFYGLFRHLKYYADYKNKIPFEYLGKRRKFYCSHFVLTMQTLAEMKENQKLQVFFEKHQPPKKYNDKLRGIALKISKIWYSIRKAFWAFGLAIRYRKDLTGAFQNQLDPLRTAPHKAVNYMINHNEQFEFIGNIIRRGDYFGS